MSCITIFGSICRIFERHTILIVLTLHPLKGKLYLDRCSFVARNRAPTFVVIVDLFTSSMILAQQSSSDDETSARMKIMNCIQCKPVVFRVFSLEKDGFPCRCSCVTGSKGLSHFWLTLNPEGGSFPQVPHPITQRAYITEERYSVGGGIFLHSLMVGKRFRRTGYATQVMKSYLSKNKLPKLSHVLNLAKPYFVQFYMSLTPRAMGEVTSSWK